MGIIRMIRFTISVLLLVHITACFWFYVAKFEDFNPDTWVVRHGYMDASNP